MDEVVQRVFFYDEHYQPYMASVPNAAALPAATDRFTATAKLLSFAETAERLGVGVQSIHAWVRAEQCPVVTGVPADWVQGLFDRGWPPPSSRNLERQA